VWLRVADLAGKFPFPDILRIPLKQSKKLPFAQPTKSAIFSFRVRYASVATNFRLSTSDFIFLFSRSVLRSA